MRCEEIDVHIIAVDALLIDCDGVLVDSHNAAATAWNGWARRWSPGFDFHRDIEHGRRITDVVAELVDPRDVDEAAADLIQAELIHAAEVPALPGARDLLNTSPPGTWAVVTSGGRAIATARMKAAGLPPAPIVVSADDVRAGKPSPDPYLLGAERLRTPPQQCAAFEDAPAGIAAARAAGVGTIIGVGTAAHTPEVSMSVANLRGMRFDGHQLTIPTDSILDRRADSRRRVPRNRSPQDLPAAAPMTDERGPYQRPEPPPSDKERDIMARLAAQWAPFGGPPPDEVFVAFGISLSEFVARCRALGISTRPGLIFPPTNGSGDR